jgi:recombination protein RecA
MAEKKIDGLQKFYAELRKEFGDTVLVPGVDEGLFSDENERVSSGSILVDRIMGGGWPKGKITLLKGTPSAGKSYLLFKAAASLTKAGEIVAWLDAEGAYSPTWASECGCDTSKIMIHRSDTMEENLDLMEALIVSGQFGGVFLDSIAALAPREEKEKSLDEWQRGLAARLLNKSLRKIQSALNSSFRESKKKPLVIYLNQIRVKMNVVYGNPETVPAGEGQKFFSQITVDVRSSGVTEEGVATSTIKTEKNKTFVPRKVTAIDYWLEGEKKGKISNCSALKNFGTEKGLIKQSGGWYKIDGVDKSFREAELFETIAKDLKFRNILLKEFYKTCPPNFPKYNYEWV